MITKKGSPYRSSGCSAKERYHAELQTAGGERRCTTLNTIKVPLSPLVSCVSARKGTIEFTLNTSQLPTPHWVPSSHIQPFDDPTRITACGFYGHCSFTGNCSGSLLSEEHISTLRMLSVCVSCWLYRSWAATLGGTRISQGSTLFALLSFWKLTLRHLSR